MVMESLWSKSYSYVGSRTNMFASCFLLLVCDALGLFRSRKDKSTVPSGAFWSVSSLFSIIPLSETRSPKVKVSEASLQSTTGILKPS